jgi:hypothetical protein
MANIVVPEIPEAVKNKTFGASDIKWVKNVNDNGGDMGRNGLNYCSAYLNEDTRLFKNSDGVFFCLQINSKFEDTLRQVPIGDIILLHQKLNNQKTKCFTHLVTPIGDKVIPCPYPEGGWRGRWVKVIAMTENQVGKSIPLISTDWLNMEFRGAHHDLSYMQGRIRGITHNQQISSQQLSSLQNNIWSKFQPWII